MEVACKIGKTREAEFHVYVPAAYEGAKIGTPEAFLLSAESRGKTIQDSEAGRLEGGEQFFDRRKPPPGAAAE